MWVEVYGFRTKSKQRLCPVCRTLAPLREGAARLSFHSTRALKTVCWLGKLSARSQRLVLQLEVHNMYLQAACVADGAFFGRTLSCSPAGQEAVDFTSFAQKKVLPTSTRPATAVITPGLGTDSGAPPSCLTAVRRSTSGSMINTRFAHNGLQPVVYATRPLGVSRGLVQTVVKASSAADAGSRNALHQQAVIAASHTVVPNPVHSRSTMTGNALASPPITGGKLRRNPTISGKTTLQNSCRILQYRQRQMTAQYTSSGSEDWSGINPL